MTESKKTIEEETEQQDTVNSTQNNINNSQQIYEGGHKFCKRCGNGIDLGNKCKICSQYPFCEMCSERSESMGRICVDCKTKNDWSCVICGKLSESQCASCMKLKEKGKITEILQTCVEHTPTHFFTSRFPGKPDNHYFICNNECDGQVCLDCVIITGKLRKKYKCKNCGNELVAKSQK